MKPLVELKNLSVQYRTEQAVCNLSLELAQGEILGIAGPNGSGKTTTLSCIEGLRRPSAGLVRVFSLDPMEHRREVYSRLGVQLQEATYPRRIRVSELCALFASFYPRPANWQELLQVMGLDRMANRAVSALSAGERQKLSVLLALMGRPQLLILDELSTGLDPESRRALQISLRRIAGNGAAMILVTHYLDELESLADRILLLDRGQQRFLGSPDAFRIWAGEVSGRASAPSTLEEAYLAACQPVSAFTLEVLP